MIDKDQAYPDKTTPQLVDSDPPVIKGKTLNLIFCAAAFLIMLGYLYFAGEAGGMAEAVANISLPFLGLGVLLMIVYWFLESVCMQMLVNKLVDGFSFAKTVIVVIIGQYFNCITPLSSGGQPMQAYYYHRFGLPLPEAMTTLLCRFIVYQLTLTIYSIIVLFLRYDYFTNEHPTLMLLVIVGFIGGIVLVGALLMLAFCKNAVIKVTNFCIRLLHKMHLCRHPEERTKKIDESLENTYVHIRYLLTEPLLLIKVSVVTVIQLTVYFSLSYVIYRGFGLGGTDYLTVISCQAFIYMISSFVPLPGAMGAAEGSYIAFFGGIYPDPVTMALSTFIWRAYIFYLPIVIGMIATLVVNRKQGKE